MSVLEYLLELYVYGTDGLWNKASLIFAVIFGSWFISIHAAVGHVSQVSSKCPMTSNKAQKCDGLVAIYDQSWSVPWRP